MDETTPAFGDTIRRPRLERLLDGAAGRRLTALVAPAGCGKTTLISQWATGRRAVWHTFTPGTTALPVAARMVLDELRKLVPDISPDLFLAVEALPGPDSDEATRGRADALAAAICQDVETHLQRDLFLVLDELHLVDEEPATIRFVAALSRAAPAALHLVTASRRPVPFQIARLVVEHQALVIDADDLAFTVHEVQELIGGADRSVAVHRRTGGWPVAVALAARSRLPEGGEPSIGDDAALFDYLAEEVLTNEPPDVRQTLVAAAHLPWIDDDLAAAVGLGGAADLLRTPRGSIYLTRTPGARGRELSPLVRSFILDRHPVPPDERTSLMRNAVRWYAAQGAFQEALACATPDEPDLVVHVLELGGDEMLHLGMARDVLDAIEALDDERARPFVLLEAEARQMTGDWEGATTCYESLAVDSGPMPPSIAWRLGFLHHMRGDLVAALDMYHRGMDGDGGDRDRAALRGWAASAHWVRGERDQAKALAEAALVLATQANDSRSLATAHTVLAMVAALDGDRSTNDRHYLRALHHAERARDVTQTIRIRCNRGSHFLEQGELDEALTELDVAMRLSDLTGFELWRGMSRANRGQVLLLRGDLEEALADFREARSIFRALGSTLEAYPLAHIGDVHALRGHDALARTAYENAIRLAEGPADLQALVPALSGLARLIARSEPDRAADLAERAAAVPSVVSRVRALVACGHVALTFGDSERASLVAAEAATLARQRRDVPGLAEACELLAVAAPDRDEARRWLDDALQLWRSVRAPLFEARVQLRRAVLDRDVPAEERARAALASLGAAAATDRLDTPGHDVSIRCLGSFEVAVAGRRVPNEAWQSRVAREVLAMLVANRGRPLNREVIVDRLWPDDDPAKSANRLSVALSTIRGVLDPERRHPAGRYVTSGDEAVALDLEHVHVDVVDFLDRAQRGRSALRRGDTAAGLDLLRSAESVYLGDAFADHPFWEWATGLREEALAVQLETLDTLADADFATGHPDAGVRRLLRVLESDPYHEPAHLTLIRAMSVAGRHGTARRMYATYVARMGELGVEPAPFPDTVRST